MPGAFPSLLAFDSSSAFIAVAVSHRGCLFERIGAGGAAASETLIPAIEASLRAAGVAPARLDAIAFCAGPGSFTGVRTAAAVAQGLAVAHGVSLIPLGSLDMLACEGGARDDASWIASVIDARMGEVYYAVHRRDANGLTRVLPATVAAPAHARAEIHELCGDAALVVGQPGLLVAQGWQPVSTLELRIDPSALMRRASALFAAGAGVPAEDAQPSYVRNKVALTIAEREARRVVEIAR